MPPATAAAVEGPYKGRLVLRKDQYVAHGTHQLLEQLEVDACWVSDSVHELPKFVLKTLRNCQGVVCLGSEFSDRDLSLVFADDLVKQVLRLVEDHAFNLEGEAPIQYV